VTLFQGQRSRSQRHVTYQITNSKNSVTGGPIKFIFDPKDEDDPQREQHKMVAMATPRLPSNGLKIMGFMTSLTTYNKHLTLVYVFTTRPL